MSSLKNGQSTSDNEEATHSGSAFLGSGVRGGANTKEQWCNPSEPGRQVHDDWSGAPMQSNTGGPQSGTG